MLRNPFKHFTYSSGTSCKKKYKQRLFLIKQMLTNFHQTLAKFLSNRHVEALPKLGKYLSMFICLKRPYTKQKQTKNKQPITRKRKRQSVSQHSCSVMLTNKYNAKVKQNL